MKTTVIKFISVLAIVFGIAGNAFAQPSADFSADITEGCAPLVVEFSVLNTTGISSYEWVTAGQSGPSNPATFAFNTPGTYTVKLTVNKGLADEDVVEKTAYITVYDKPSAAFSITSDTVCYPFTVDFVDETTSNGYGVTQWSWDFKNGTPLNNSTNSSPSIKYTSAGVYNTSLIAENPNLPNCKDTAFQTIVVINQPIADFSVTPTGACAPPLDVTFANNSTEGFEYIWDFGNGEKDTTNSTTGYTQTFSNYGSYNPSLTVQGYAGSCKDTETKAGGIKIVDVQASLEATTTVTCVGNTVVFNSTDSQSADNYYWDFADGTAIVSNSTGTTNHIFNSPGTYAVNVTVENASVGCIDVATLNVYVENVQADFSPSQDYFCSAPSVVTFTDQSTTDDIGFVTWSWTFEGGGSSSQQNPNYNFSPEGIYSVTLTATSTHGCKTTIIKPDLITVSYPHALIADYDPIKGCEALDVTFTDGSKDDMSGNIIDWQWDFGDGNSTTTSTAGASVVNTFVKDSMYFVTLTVVNDLGCTDDTVVVVEVGSKPIADFTFTPTESCARDTIFYFDQSSFVDPTIPLDSLDEWIWLGSGGFGANIQDPTHLYDIVDAVGLNSITLTVGYNGCYDTIFYNDTLNIIGPIVESIDTIGAPSCDSTRVRTFTMLAVDTTSFIWVMSDILETKFDTIMYANPAVLSPGSNLGGVLLSTDMDTIKYMFPDSVSVDYLVSVIAWNDNAEPFDTQGYGCEFKKTIKAKIRDVNAKFVIVSDSICKKGAAQFIAVNTTNPADTLLPKDVLRWQWKFGDGDTTALTAGAISTSLTVGYLDNLQHIYQDTGVYNVELIVQDIYDCMASVNKPVYVFEPQAGFVADTNKGCLPTIFQLTDTTVSQIPIAGYLWDYGTGPKPTPPNNPNMDAPLNTKGIHTLFMTVTDELGCKDVASMNVEIIKPTAKFSLSDTTLCQGTSLTFSNSSTPYTATYPLDTYKWQLSTGAVYSSKNPTVTFQDTGYYDISLTITDAAGCTAVANKFDYVHVQGLPIIGVVPNDTLFECYPAAFSVVDTSWGDYIHKRTWDLGNGVVSTWTYDPLDPNANDYDTVATNYVDPGYYDVSLQLETTYGCVSDTTFKKFVLVDGPDADFLIYDTLVCLNDTVHFEINSINYLVDHWEWVLGNSYKLKDSIGLGSNDTTFAYTFLPAVGDYFNASLVLYDITGDCKIQFDQNIYIYSVEADFLMNGLVNDTIYSCPPFNVTFTDASTNVTDWTWDFGNGNTSAVQNPGVQTYVNSSDTAIAVLNISGNAGKACGDKKEKYIITYPEPILEMSSDTVICLGDDAEIFVKSFDSNVSYLWKPEATLNYDTILAPIATPDDTTVYSVTVTNSYNCKSYDSVKVSVIATPFVSVSPSDTLIIIGDSARLQVENLQDGFKVKWSPATDLMCVDCTQNIFFGTDSADYIVSIVDEEERCPVKQEFVHIEVKEACAVDVADALTPNGDGDDDFIYLRGWGIKEVLMFDIYNRWGERVYQNPGDINHGWDGTFNGKPQPMDTYILVARVEFYCNIDIKEIKKQITLFR